MIQRSAFMMRRRGYSVADRDLIHPQAVQHSKYHVEAENGVQNAMLAVLLHPCGITAIAVSVLIGFRIDATLSKLRMLRDRGEIGSSRKGGCKSLWMTSAATAISRLAHAEEKRNEAAESQARRHAKKRSAAIAEKEAAEDSFLAPIVQRIIPAIHADRIYPAGPRSVFDMCHG